MITMFMAKKTRTEGRYVANSPSEDIMIALLFSGLADCMIIHAEKLDIIAKRARKIETNKKCPIID